ncbi:MAG: helix-turn-helix domain-containing protein [Coprococcus comes]
MSEPKHSNVLLGKSIREIRLRRGLTQREVSEAIGGISESALRSYELGERRPKQNTLERIAETLDVAPACFDTYGIERYDELVHALFLLEDRFGIEPCADGSIRFTDEAIQSCVCTWRDWKEFLEKGKITREEYENRKDSFLR